MCIASLIHWSIQLLSLSITLEWSQSLVDSRSEEGSSSCRIISNKRERLYYRWNYISYSSSLWVFKDIFIRLFFDLNIPKSSHEKMLHAAPQNLITDLTFLYILRSASAWCCSLMLSVRESVLLSLPMERSKLEEIMRLVDLSVYMSVCLSVYTIPPTVQAATLAVTLTSLLCSEVALPSPSFFLVFTSLRLVEICTLTSSF